MIDALGAPQSALLLGATSDIGRAIVDRFAAAGRLQRLALAGRSAAALAAEATRRRAQVQLVTTHPMDASRPAEVAGVVDAGFAAGDLDVVLVAFGVLPDQAAAVADASVAIATATVNYVAAAAACVAAAAQLRRQGHGVLIVLSSVAALRPRPGNYVYGSSKAGLDALARGLADDLRGSGASVLLVRPGFVHSAMTRGRTPAPLATTPAVVADAVFAGLGGGNRIIWVPGSMRAVLAVIRVLPQSLLRRLPS